MASGHEDTGYRPAHNVPMKLAPLPQQPTTTQSKAERRKSTAAPPNKVRTRNACLEFLYNKEKGEIFYRTPKSWLLIISYSIMYLIFLFTYTITILYVSLLILKEMVDFSQMDAVKLQFLQYPERGIGLTAAPTSENNAPLIWYKKGEKEDYSKYVKALDKLLSSKRRKREVSSLGPCGQSPYGYGEKPCVIVRINKRFNWAGQPLQINSTAAKSAPAEVQTWMKADRTKLWLQCSGFHSYDKEHIGKIKYYPDPPGFDANMFPLDAIKKSPLVAIQISEFTLGISLAIQCTLWYENGPSHIDFVLYVAPAEKMTNTSVNV